MSVQQDHSAKPSNPQTTGEGLQQSPPENHPILTSYTAGDYQQESVQNGEVDSSNDAEISEKKEEISTIETEQDEPGQQELVSQESHVTTDYAIYNHNNNNTDTTMNGTNSGPISEEGEEDLDEEIAYNIHTNDKLNAQNGLNYMKDLSQTFELLTTKLGDEQIVLKDTHFKDYTRLDALKDVLHQTDEVCKEYYDAGAKLAWQMGKMRDILVTIRSTVDKKLGDEGLYSWLADSIAHTAG